MQKIVINRTFGVFKLSDEAMDWLRARGCVVSRFWNDDTNPSRDDSLLVKCVETLGGAAASAPGSLLKIAEIPDGVDWEIEEHDGMEWVSEVHKRWY